MLGYIVSEHGVESDPEKIEYIAEARLSQSKKKLRSFLTFYSFNRRFVHEFLHIAARFQ